VQISLYRRGRQWWGKYRQNGRVVRRSFRTENRKLADEARGDLEQALRGGALVSPTLGPMPPPAQPGLTIRAFVVTCPPDSVRARLVDQRRECRLPLRDAAPVFDRGRAFLDDVERGWRRRLRATERLRV
jgi:hypothetical protein